LKLYFDGGCKPNPGKMEVAVVSDDGSIKEHARIHDGTNNEAEWLAFLWAASIAISKGFNRAPLTILGDSKLVISQAQGVWQVKQPSLAVFRDEFRTMEPEFKQLRLVHVLRGVNPAGHYIEEVNG
jgi:ribonuclease HI